MFSAVFNARLISFRTPNAVFHHTTEKGSRPATWLHGWCSGILLISIIYWSKVVLSLRTFIHCKKQKQSKQTFNNFSIFYTNPQSVFCIWPLVDGRLLTVLPIHQQTDIYFLESISELYIGKHLLSSILCASNK